MKPVVVAGIVLAGGRSARMGRNKALMPLGGPALIEHVIRRIAPQVASLAINAAPGWAERFGYPVVPDRIAGQAGPLAGIAAGLRHVAQQQPDMTHMLSVPVDSPFFPADLTFRMTEALAAQDDIAIARSAGRIHPVFGLWPVSAAADMEAWLGDEHNRKVRLFLARRRVHEIDFPPIETPDGPFDPFFNINTPDDLAFAARHLHVIAP